MEQTITGYDIQKLPKWAQTELNRLQMRLREAREEIKRRDENPPSNTVVGSTYCLEGEKPIYLRNNQSITFLLKNGQIRIRVDKDHLDVNSSGGDILAVSPRACNSLYLSLPKIQDTNQDY